MSNGRGIGKRIKKLRVERGLTQSELGKVLGVKKSTISMYEHGKITPSDEAKRFLADYFGVTFDFLMDGNTGGVGSFIVPVFASVSAGNPVLTDNEIVGYEELPKKWKEVGEFFGLKVKGDSMLPRFVSGDTLIVQKQNYVDSGDLAIVLINGEEATFKQVLKTDGGIMLIGLNSEAFKPRFFSWHEVQSLPVTILGKVVELRGKI